MQGSRDLVPPCVHGLIAHFFLALNNIPFMDIPHIIDLPIKGYLTFFLVSAMTDKAAVNIRVQVSELT